MARLLEDLLAHFEASSCGNPTSIEFAEAVSGHTQDLVDLEGLRLAFDVLRGHEVAIHHLTRVIGRAVAQLGSRLAGGADDRAELAQATLVVLLYGGTRRQRGYLYTYAGRAPLDGWVRKAVVRKGLARQKTESRWLSSSDLEMTSVSEHNPERELLERTDARQFKDALNRGVASLSSREREVLGKHLNEHLTAAEIGSHFGVHRVTVARWLQGIRKQLFRSTSSHLNARPCAESVCPAEIFPLVADHVDFAPEQLCV